VEVSATDHEHDRELGEGEDQQGVSRVVAALHAHTWPGLQRKPMAAAQAPSSDTTHDGANGARSPNAADGAHEDLPHSGEPSAVNGTLQHDGGEPTAEPQEGGDIGREEESVEERAFEQFEAMLSSLAGSRDHLKDLPDDDRRTLAADFAMKMLGAFGVEDDTESDEEV
jgi:hypothetical protein